MTSNKVAILVNSLSCGGAERVVSVIANKSDIKDLELIVLEKNQFYPLNDNIALHELTNNYGNENIFTKFLNIFKAAIKLKSYVKDNNITTIQSHLYRANFINIISKIIGSKHNVQVVNTDIVLENDSGFLNFPKRFVKKIMVNTLYNSSDLIVFKSYGMKENFLANFFNVKNKIKKTIIPNPYDINKIQKLQKETVDLDKNITYLVSIGSLIDRKRNQDLLEAFCLLNKSYQNIHLLYIGEGINRQHLEKLTNRHNLQDKVTFLGQQSNPFKYLQKNSMFILNSQNEGFPNVLVEAMACGVPVISADCLSGPREILNKQFSYHNMTGKEMLLAKYGILYPIGSIKALSGAITKLLEDSTLRDKYAKQSMVRAEDFNLEVVLNKYKQLLVNKYMK